MEKIRLCVVGCGGFSNQFIRLFQVHPQIERVWVTDLLPERAADFRARYGVGVFESFEQALASDEINAVAIFTQRHTHGPLVPRALRAGKHVYSAVPMANSMEEIQAIIDAVLDTRLIYSMGETAYYYPGAVLCRQAIRENRYGKFVYGESQYYHRIDHMYNSFKRSGGENWKAVAGVPPMHYPTHSIAGLVTALDDHVTQVTCYGYADSGADGIYGKGKNLWDNPFSNETALLQFSQGGIGRANEFRRLGPCKSTSYVQCFYGEDGGYECAFDRHYDFRMVDGKCKTTDITALLNSENMEAHRADTDFLSEVAAPELDYRSMSPVMPKERLPKEFEPEEAGHRGVHKFLIDDFVKGALSGKLPPCHAWMAAKINAPGLIAHESAMQGGRTLEVPYFGEPPADWALLEPNRGISRTW